MELTPGNLVELYRGYRVLFNQALQGAKPQWSSFGMRTPSGSAEEVYAWLGAVPGMKKFLGEAKISNTNTNRWTIVNHEWEDTVAVKEADIERDSYGIYNPLISSMGLAAGEHPDELFADLLLDGFTLKDYTGLAFFANNKPHNPDVQNSRKFSNKGTKKLSAANYSAARAAFKALKNAEGRPMGLGRKLQLIVSPINEELGKKILQAALIDGGNTNTNKDSAELVVFDRLGDSEAWFLVEAGLPIKPLIYQEEKAPTFTSVNKPGDSYVMLYHKFLYQVFGRYNAGYGMPQLAWGSTGADAA